MKDFDFDFDFDIDCGQPFPGYRLILTGLSADGLSNDGIHADFTGHAQGKPVHSMMSVTYRVTPALVDATFDGCDIEVSARLDPPLDPNWWPGKVEMTEEREDIPGAIETHGARGPFVVPAETRRIELAFGTYVATKVSNLVDPEPPSDHVPHPLGQLVIDLSEQTVAWHPA